MSPQPVEPTELVVGAWQLRPWPAAYADLDELLAERYDASTRLPQRDRRLDGWADGGFLGFGIREITTGASVGEVVVIVDDDRTAHVETWVRRAVDPHDVVPVAGDAVRRWVTGALGLSVR